MSDANTVATAVSMLSLIVAMSAAVWSVASWRRDGPLLRIHAHLYDEVLTVQVFNAGRTPERIERVVLGGVRRGRHGVDITADLGAPRTLEPSGVIHKEVHWSETVAPRRQWLVRQGWESLWILTGSMREHRADVLPTQQPRPPATGWHLATRHDQQTRYGPLIMSVPLGALVLDAPAHTASIDVLFAVVVLVLIYRFYRANVRPGTSVRTKVQNCSVVLGSIAVIVGWIGGSLPPGVFAAYLLVAVALALPAVIPGLVIEGESALTQLRALRNRARLPRR